MEEKEIDILAEAKNKNCLLCNKDKTLWLIQETFISTPSYNLGKALLFLYKP